MNAVYCGVRIVLTTFGTDGDVFPFLGLGRQLVERGHTVLLVTSGHYRSRAIENRFEFHELISREETDSILGNPDFWHPIKGGPLAARWGVRFISRQYALLSGLVSDGQTVLVANPAVFAARLVQDRFQTPLASVVLQPWLIPSVYKPPIMPGGLTLPRGSPRWLWKIYFRALHFAGDQLIGRQLNRLRAELGLPRVRHVFDWWLSPKLILALFPERFGPAQPDWPQSVRQLSFPIFDGVAEDAGDPGIEAFLRAGAPPVAITFGTGIRHAKDLYRAAVEGCARLEKRGMIITKYPEQIPDPLPDGFLATRYAPFSTLFPRCAAVIHHGGVGTLAAALQSSVPQLIVPFGYDQLDNAIRVQELGGGFFLRLRQANAQRIARALEKALTLQVSSRNSDRSAFVRAAELIEGLVRSDERPCAHARF